jgi:hypothetical protein
LAIPEDKIRQAQITYYINTTRKLVFLWVFSHKIRLSIYLISIKLPSFLVKGGFFLKKFLKLFSHNHGKTKSVKKQKLKGEEGTKTKSVLLIFLRKV